MALYQFSTSLETTASELSAKLNKWYEDGASLTDITIVDTNNITMLINDKYCNVQYSKSLSSKANYYWFLCDSYGYETLIILCDSPTVSENGYRSTLGSALYNAIYFLHNDRLIRNQYVDESLCSQFNIPNGQVVSNVDDRMIFTKCTFNDSINLDTGSSEVTDRLYVSTNLVSAGFLTEISGSGEKFVNIGGIFYMPLNNLVLGLSHYKNRSILKNAGVELWSGCLDDNEKIYDRTEKVTFYKNKYNNIKLEPEGNREMGYIDLKNGNRLLLTSDKPFFNKTIYLVAYDTSTDEAKNFTDDGTQSIVTGGFNKKIIISGERTEYGYCNSMFSLAKIVEWEATKTPDNPSYSYLFFSDGYDEIGYALVNNKSDNIKYWGISSINSKLLSHSTPNNIPTEYYYSGNIFNSTYQDAVWCFEKIKPKKYIYVLRTPTSGEEEYCGFINKTKLKKTNSYKACNDDSDYYLIIGGVESHFWPLSDTPREDIKAYNMNELKIDYFAIVDEAQSDEEIEANIKYLADKFKVDLES